MGLENTKALGIPIRKLFYIISIVTMNSDFLSILLQYFVTMAYATVTFAIVLSTISGVIVIV